MNGDRRALAVVAAACFVVAVVLAVAGVDLNP